MSAITPIDAHSVHRITSGQVVVDLQSAVKELVENSLDAGATSIEVRFYNHGLKTVEVVDNGSGIAPKDHDSIALKHHTSKLSTFEDLSRVLTFGFRGEALSSLCALTDELTVTTATASEAPMGTVIEMDRNGRAHSKCKIARQKGTTIAVTNLFKPLPVRRKEFERNTKREFQKALNLLYAYAVVPCALEHKGVRLAVSNQTEGGRKVLQFKTDGSPSIRASVLAVWGSRALDNVVDLDLSFDVETEKSIQRRVDNDISIVTPVKVQGLISKFALGAGRTSSDRQFFFVNGRPYNPGKVQKAINEVYRTFNINQSPFVIANIILPTNACDINISPDKRTIFLHSENNFVQALRTALETAFSAARSTYDVTSQPSQMQVAQQTKNQAKQPIETRERTRETGKERSQPERVSSTLDVERDYAPPCLASTGPDRPIMLDEPDEESEAEPEPEPTLVAQPRPCDKTLQSGVSGARKGRNAGNGGMVDMERAASEPLFFPDSDEDPKEQRESRPKNASSSKQDPAPQVVRGPIASSGSKTPRCLPTNLADASCSVQTVLSTRGAAWNLRTDGDADGGRERKRMRLSSEADRVRTKRKSFRSSLSQFIGSGRKAFPDARDSESESGSEGDVRDGREHEEGKSDDEIDELDDVGDEGAQRLATGKKNRRRAGSDSSQVTMVVPSDGEHAMDVDEPSGVSKPPRAVTSAPEVVADEAGESGDDWAFSSTLVGTYVPPADKTIEPPSKPTNTHTESDTDLVTLRVDLIRIGAYYLDMYSFLSSSQSTTSPAAATPTSTVRSAVSSANLETAAEDTIASAALSRIISKTDFEHMTVVGQFNLGFIIVRKRTQGTGAMDDLFIVDQHAADEKWNFETLQEKTVIASQKLFRPQQLQLTAADEMLAMENMDVLQSNGFELRQVEEQEAVSGERADGVRMRLELVAQPMSKDTVFDIKDLEELLHLMQDRPRGSMVRCSKARAMFAMRACRRSVMIGKALDKPQMTAIVRHMGTMDQPWNCPHGRPTMRHLSDLTAFGGYVPRREEIDWGHMGMDLGRGEM